MTSSKSGGFSLVEVLISSVVLSIGALGLVKLQSSLRIEFEQLQVQQEALYLARQKQQDLFAAASRLSNEQQLEYQLIKDDSGGRMSAGVLPDREQTINATQFARYWQVRAMNWIDTNADGIDDAWQMNQEPEGHSHIKAAAVTIEWKDPQGHMRSITQHSTLTPTVVMPLKRIITLGEQAKRTPD